LLERRSGCATVGGAITSSTLPEAAALAEFDRIAERGGADTVAT